MRAAVLRKGTFEIDTFDDPVPEAGQVLVDVKACGICGSDLHFVKHGAKMMGLVGQMGGTPMSDGDRPQLDLDGSIFMGHEFAGEILEAGPDTATFPVGTLVTSFPVLLSSTGFAAIVYSNTVHGGYGERMLLSAPLLLEVPNGLDASRASLTEPMAVGLHAVNKSKIEQGTGALVLGCGPVGQSVIAALKVRGIEPIVAADFSPARRALALKMGAADAVDPNVESAFDAWARVGGSSPVVIFEAIGVPGIINEVMRMAPIGSQIVVVGVCMEPDTITPFFGIGKELNIQFAYSYDPTEFAGSLRSIAEGEIDVSPLITAEVPLEGMQQAFEDLADPEQHCKIIVTP
ncbi:MAG: hypothetical protein QOI47_151 [Actinomycetota bacterium]|jgi:2-desacetyl-2-hydroxyethyl bacteriochlorophyllide A dehydrogenase|nr:hypothetical protein [Actinomycetota bacterium]